MEHCSYLILLHLWLGERYIICGKFSMFLINILMHILVFLYMNHISLIFLIGIFWAYMWYLLVFTWCFLPSSQYLCFHNCRLRESPPLSHRHTQTHTLALSPSCVCAIFFPASATCVVAMFLCLYISEHLFFQQGPHGLKCQSKQLPDKCIVQQACVSPPPILALLVLWC